MTDQNQSITNKMEDLFLSILRGVILVVLAGSVIAAIYFAIAGVSDLGAKPKDYKYEKFDSKQLVNDLKDSLNPKPAPANNSPAAAPAPPAVKNPINDEITKIVNLTIKYFKAYNLEFNQGYLDRLPSRFDKESKKLSAVYGDGDNAQLEYLKGKTQLFETVLLNAELNQLLDKNFKAEPDQDDRNKLINDFYVKVSDFYSDFHKEQIDKKDEFEASQNAEVAMRNAGSMIKLYTAGGLFAAFLLISLILVLVKIERNLRTTKLQEAVEY
jgi:hypothetical protein